MLSEHEEQRRNGYNHYDYSASSERRCQAANVMSGPIPAGSPTVRASGRVIAYLYSISAWLRSSFMYFFASAWLMTTTRGLLGASFSVNPRPRSSGMRKTPK